MINIQLYKNLIHINKLLATWDVSLRLIIVRISQSAVEVLRRNAKYWHRKFSVDQKAGFAEIPIHEHNFVSEIIFSSSVRVVFHSTPSASWNSMIFPCIKKNRTRHLRIAGRKRCAS